ncbi:MULTISPECIES: SDR family oxidoreductase [unclassified Microbacterium]|uniref:SDR family oxidoreductase n=1 Tax=unclassified Microbacterium TaxID=2609290 RepID=UPI00214B6386|nr:MULTISPECIES: SDR family oxidoreductase [unclassified Microbacterium]MCR2783666.1 SDR family oxidoreductase [Microbacterium sp. zg.B96]WIM15476.1 SDR family oxidoreductase [Microbacterium sp. zg-B96]
MRIVVAGGTGLAGRRVVATARERGHDVVALSRSSGTDAASGAGLRDALTNADVVVDTLNVATLNARESEEFFRATTANLLAAEGDVGVAHHVALSIVNCDRAPYGYYTGKVAQESLVTQGEVPWTILRVTQFHDFAAQMFTQARVGPLRFAPRMRTQPVAIGEVAARLVDLAEAAPAGRATDLAGPREESLAAMVRAYARATGRGGWIPAVPLPGRYGRAQRDGTMLPGPDADRGTGTFGQWLATLSGCRA